MRLKSSAVTIRPYASNDKEGCLEAFKSNMPRYFAPHELEDFDNWLEQQPARMTTNDDEAYFVAELEQSIIACGGYHYDKNTNVTHMTWGMVKQDYHRRGIGKGLLQYRLKVIKDRFPESVIGLDTTQYSAPFFERLGFKTTRITEHFYAPGFHRIDMILENNAVVCRLLPVIIKGHYGKILTVSIVCCARTAKISRN